VVIPADESGSVSQHQSTLAAAGSDGLHSSVLVLLVPQQGEAPLGPSVVGWSLLEASLESAEPA